MPLVFLINRLASTGKPNVATTKWQQKNSNNN